MGNVLAPSLGTFVGSDLHVLAHECTGIEDLPIQRSGNVLCVTLIRCLIHGQSIYPSIGNCLNECSR